MPYKFGGRLSSGCELCISRRVKCDETKPTCQKCVKYGGICKYRDEPGLFFHNHEDSSGKDSESPLETGVSQISEITVPVIERARGRFFYDFLFMSAGHTHIFGYLEYLPALLSKKASADSPLGVALESISFINFSNRCNAPPVKLLALRKYGLAMQLINTALKDPVESRRDETLVACHLVGILEILAADTGNFERFQKHGDGIIALLKHRGTQQFKSPYGIPLFRMILMQETLRCLKIGKRSQVQIEDYRFYLDGFTYRFIALSNSAISLVADYIEATENAVDEDVSSILRLIDQATALDSSFEDWISHLPDVFRFKPIPKDQVEMPDWLIALLGGEGALEVVHTYSYFSVFVLSDSIRMAQLRVYQVLAKASLTAGNHVSAKRSMEKLDNCIEKIYCTLGSFLFMPIGDHSGETTAVTESATARTLFASRYFMAVRAALKAPWAQDLESQRRILWLDRVLSQLESN